jgi:hypothetical protein
MLAQQPVQSAIRFEHIFLGRPGRLFHGAIVGLCIGLMIALAEVLFREAYLAVEYRPKEVRYVSLGATPVIVGSDHSATVYAPDAAPKAFRYVLEAGRIIVENLETNQREGVAPGDLRRAGKVKVTVSSASSHQPHSAPGALPASSPAAPGTGVANAWTAQQGPAIVVAGRAVPLRLGQRLTSRELPGLEPRSGDGIVAEVVSHPFDPQKLGLKNHSRVVWSVLFGSLERRVEPGQSVQLARGTRIRGAGFEGEPRG